MRIAPSPGRAWIVCALVVAAAWGCRATKKEEFSPNHAVLPWAEFSGNQVTVHNIRNTEYRTAEDYTVRHYDKSFDLEKLDSVDFKHLRDRLRANSMQEKLANAWLDRLLEKNPQLLRI